MSPFTASGPLFPLKWVPSFFPSSGCPLFPLKWVPSFSPQMGALFFPLKWVPSFSPQMGALFFPLKWVPKRVSLWHPVRQCNPKQPLFVLPSTNLTKKWHRCVVFKSASQALALRGEMILPFKVSWHEIHFIFWYTFFLFLSIGDAVFSGVVNCKNVFFIIFVCVL